MVTSNVKMCGRHFVDVDICHPMVSLRKLYSVTLAYLLKVKMLNFYYN